MSNRVDSTLHAMRALLAKCAAFTLALATSFNVAHAADPGVARICDEAAAAASQAEGTPVNVLRAITRTETGRSGDGGLQPWPWTVNMEGAGRWFDSPDEALAYATANFQRGARSFDVGCFQINYKWHGHAFSSIEEMFDPLTNARYAARFLRDLYQELGDWSAAAGAFHSRTPKYAKRYTARFDRIFARMEGLPEPQPMPLTQLAETEAPRAIFGPPQPLGLDRPLANGPFIGIVLARVPVASGGPEPAGGTARLGSLVAVSADPSGPRPLFVID